MKHELQRVKIRKPEASSFAAVRRQAPGPRPLSVFKLYRSQSLSWPGLLAATVDRLITVHCHDRGNASEYGRGVHDEAAITYNLKRRIKTDFGVLLCFVEPISHKRHNSSRRRPKTLHEKARGHGKTNISPCSVSVY